jgi:hypothetical protein
MKIQHYYTAHIRCLTFFTISQSCYYTIEPKTRMKFDNK